MKKILISIIFSLFLTKISFASSPFPQLSCKGVMTITSSKGLSDKEYFYDDLDFYIKKQDGAQKLLNIINRSTSHQIFRSKTWISNFNFSINGLVINFNQPPKTTDDGDSVRGFKGTLNLKTGNYSGTQYVKGKWTSMTWKIVAECSGMNQVLAALDFDDRGDDKKVGGSSGTAFLINNNGYLLTNHHVVDGCDVSKIMFEDKEYKTRLIAKDKFLDLALLKADIRNRSFINFSNEEIKKMQKIFVAGYPFGKGLSDDLKITSGIISSLKGFQDNSNEVQIDAAINPGNSGGPIINEKGDLIAVAVSGLSKDRSEGVNFGIKSSAVEGFLKSNNIKPNSSFFSKSKNNDQLLNILEKSTVYTFCN